MTLKQFLTAVNHLPEFEVNRILQWDVGRALTRPVTNPLLKAFCGYILGIAVFGFGGMMIGAAMGTRPNEDVVRLLALALAVVFALTPNTPSVRHRDSGKPASPAI